MMYGSGTIIVQNEASCILRKDAEKAYREISQFKWGLETAISEDLTMENSVLRTPTECFLDKLKEMEDSGGFYADSPQRKRGRGMSLSILG